MKYNIGDWVKWREDLQTCQGRQAVYLVIKQVLPDSTYIVLDTRTGGLWGHSVEESALTYVAKEDVRLQFLGNIYGKPIIDRYKKFPKELAITVLNSRGAPLGTFVIMMLPNPLYSQVMNLLFEKEDRDEIQILTGELIGRTLTWSL